MKFGDNLESLSVPKWSIHNVNYNSLKQFIKLNTKTKAIPIPEQRDEARIQYEDQLLSYLLSEHNRIDLFVRTTAKELSRRLDHLTMHTHDFLSGQGASAKPTKKLRRIVRLRQDLLQVNEDIQNLPRFVSAQSEAFRKLIKKHRRWTGSSSVDARFKFDISDDPKSFTRMDFSDLKSRVELVSRDINKLGMHLEYTTAPPSQASNTSETELSPSLHDSTSTSTLPCNQYEYSPKTRYWNEYEDGSDAGDPVYEIYVTPDKDESLLPSWATSPFAAVSGWFRRGRRLTDDLESSASPLLSGDFSTPSYGSSDVHSQVDSDDEGAEAGSQILRPRAYLPLTLHEQRIQDVKNMVKARITIGLFCVASILLTVATILLLTGAHKAHIKVNIGVTMGVTGALVCAFLGLAMMLMRTDRKSILEHVLLYTWFTVVCIGSGCLLVNVAEFLV